MTIYITGNNLTLASFMEVVRNKRNVCLAEEAKLSIQQSRTQLERLMKTKKTIYGVNTGFGKLSDVVVDDEKLQVLQSNLLKSHACGVGRPFDEEVVRGMMLLRINALAKGYSGIRLEVVEKLIEFLNKGIIPMVPEQGSLGASGDLAPLSHIGLTLLGLGKAYYQGKCMDTKEALQFASICEINQLEAKEGLCLINGTQAMTSLGAITTYDALSLLEIANAAASLSMEALRGIIDAFDKRLHQARGQIGQMSVANHILRLLEDSAAVTKQGDVRIQDPYSLRCIAQVHGACLDTFYYVKEKIEIEMNAATDNPLLFDHQEVLSGGNFHGEPIAFAMDFIKIAISELASISERRIERMVNPHLSCGLPAFLVANPGINSGFMIVQYSAASIVSENKVLSHPASVDSIPSSANQEDHVSMGTIAARGARDILENTKKVIAMELLTACQAVQMRNIFPLGKGTNLVYHAIREKIPYLEQDAEMYQYINSIQEFTSRFDWFTIVQDTIGKIE